MSNRWPEEDVKSRFDELLDATLADGPQFVTRDGVETAVVIEVKQWRRLEKAGRSNLKQLLLAPEARTENLTPPRKRYRRRKTETVG